MSRNYTDRSCPNNIFYLRVAENNSSLRNCLDDWFKQRNLRQPLFEDTEAQGSKATFSVDLTCTHPGKNDTFLLCFKDIPLTAWHGEILFILRLVFTNDFRLHVMVFVT